MEKARDHGIEAYKTGLNAKVRILEELLSCYNDGRRKGFYCLAINLLELADIEVIMEKIRSEVSLLATSKEKAVAAVSLFNTIADEKGISLKLRK